MPPVAFHCLTHLTTEDFLKVRFPAIHNIKFSEPGSPEHYSLRAMMLWASIPYGIWQISYHIFITVRRREKIAAGRPTSFTWLRKSYAKTWIGKIVIALPAQLQEPAFMMIQYIYALLTMTPCPIWFWYRRWSAAFLMVVFIWSIYNGATYYIDVFGKRFQKELEQLKKDVAKWQSSPDGFTSPLLSPENARGPFAGGNGGISYGWLGQIQPRPYPSSGYGFGINRRRTSRGKWWDHRQGEKIGIIVPTLLFPFGFSWIFLFFSSISILRDIHFVFPFHVYLIR